VTFSGKKPSATLRALLGKVIDYAGLFPPAKLPMSEAVKRYAEYLESDHAWALGRFVVPVERLDEFRAARRSSGAANREWRLSAVLGTDTLQGCAAIRRYDESGGTDACVDSLEFRIRAPSKSLDQISPVVNAVPQSVRAFVEVPLGSTQSVLLDAARDSRACAKIRTGGTTVDAFPSPAELASFLIDCADRALPFKATAGLHHPCRGIYPLTYDDAAPVATMFGFLNVLLAAVLARAAKGRETIISILEVEDVSEFWFGSEEIRWRDVRLSQAQLKETRNHFALSFGSCSFEEPIEDLRALSLL
jgi:hypothetical protein